MRDSALSRPFDPAGVTEGEIPRHLQHQTLISNLSGTLHVVGHDHLGHRSLRLLAVELPLHDHCQEKGQDRGWYVLVLSSTQAQY